MSTAASQYQLLPDLTADEYEALKADIAARGVLVPVELDEQGNVLDGHHRLRVCAELGIRDYPRVTRPGMDEDEKCEHVLSLNLDRRQLTNEQKRPLAVMLRGRGWTLQRIATKLAVSVGLVHSWCGTNFSEMKSCAEPEPGADGKVRPQQYSRRPAIISTTDRQQETVQKHLQEVPEEALPDGLTDARAVQAAAKTARRDRAVEAMRARETEPPTGEFDVIACDPPWSYDSRAVDGTHRAANPYPSMTVEQIAALDVPAAPDCILWLWTTNAHMHEAFHVLEAWGFEPKTILTWAKDRMGLGDWLRGQTEHCILAVRGRPVVNLTNETTVLHGPLREHSRKPDEFYTLVERLCPGRRLEMFARQGRRGWHSYGNDTEHFHDVA